MGGTCASLCLRVWSRIIFESRGKITAVGDALGVLCGATKFRAKDPKINALMMDLALLFAPTGCALDAVHIWSEDNQEADALSRLSVGAAVPPRLRSVRETSWPLIEGALASRRAHA